MASILGSTIHETGNKKRNTNGAEVIPNRNMMRHVISPLRGCNNPPNIPLIPRIRPFTSIKIAEDIPNKIPPKRDSKGVKF